MVAVEEFLASKNLGVALLEERGARLIVPVPGVAVEIVGGSTGKLGEAPEAAALSASLTSSASIASTSSSSSAITKYCVSPSILVKTELFLVLWATGVVVNRVLVVILSLEGSGGSPSEVLAMVECRRISVSTREFVE